MNSASVAGKKPSTIEYDQASLNSEESGQDLRKKKPCEKDKHESSKSLKRDKEGKSSKKKRSTKSLPP